MFCSLWSPVPRTESSLLHVVGNCQMNRALSDLTLSIIMSHQTSSSPTYSHLSDQPALSLNTPYFPRSSVPFSLLLPLLPWLVLTCSSLLTQLRRHLYQKAFLGFLWQTEYPLPAHTNDIACCLHFCPTFTLNHITSLKVLFDSIVSVPSTLQTCLKCLLTEERIEGGYNRPLGDYLNISFIFLVYLECCCIYYRCSVKF